MTTKRWIERIELAVMLWVMGLAAAQAATTFVAVTGSDTTGTGSQASPWRSVTNAVAHAGVSDVIQVAAGVYTQNVVMATTNVTIQGGYNSADWSWSPSNQLSVIYGNGNVPITLSLASVTNTVRYVTLTGGSAGLQMNGNNAAIIMDGCTITGNYYGVYSPAEISGQQMVIRNTLIARNSASGIYAYIHNGNNGGSCQLYNCTIANNGSHGYWSNAGSSRANLAPFMTNTLVTGNNGYGIYMPYNGSYGVVSYSLFYGNALGPWFGYVTDGGHNQLSQDPKYVNAASNNYQLQGNSPAAASGVSLSAAGVTNDLVNAGRPGTYGWDMGVYQGSGTGAPPPVAVGYVSKLGSDSADGSSNTPWASLSFGLGRLNATGTLYVASGVYTDNLCLGAGTLAIRGGYTTNWTWDPAHQRTTVFGNTNPPVSVLSTVSTNTLSYLTVCGGTGGGIAGIQVSANSCGVVIEGCTITGNVYGVKVNAAGATLALRNSLIARNTSHGFLAAPNDGVRFPYPGGGKCALLNCTLANNGGHGYHCYLVLNDGATALSPYITNTLFTGNGGYGIYMPGQGSAGRVDYSLFYGNTLGPWYGFYAPITDGGHNKLGQDPKYVDAVNNNYQLQAFSPAATSGVSVSTSGVTNDILNAFRPGTYGWDMGAYQGNGTGAPPLVAYGYVSKLGNDSTGDGSQGSPWASVTYGLGRLNATGTLYVASGVYTDNVAMYAGAVTIRGGYDPASWSWMPASQRTVIFGNTNPPVTLFSGSSTNTLSYLTLCGGTGSGVSGIRVFAPCSLVVDGCTITGNTYGVASDNFIFQPLFRNTLIARNNSYGIYAPVIYGGGGVCRLYNCTLANNGGHAFFSAANPNTQVPLSVQATNTLFTANAGCGIALNGAGTAGAGYSLFYGNTAGAWAATNNANANVFTDTGNNITNQDAGYVNAASNNYQITAASAAFRSGTNLTAQGVTNDILGLIRPKNGAFDRGAYALVIRGSAVFFR